MAKEDQIAVEGLRNLAHAIRRSTAAYIAMSVTEPGSSIEEMLENAETIATWIKGKAGQADEERASEPPREPLGIPFGQRDTD